MLLTILAFIIILGILVLVHELGHFITARIFKTDVEEFGMGFPPRAIGTYKDKDGQRKWVWGKKFKSEDAPNTIYSLNWFPLGGFVKIKGENEAQTKELGSFGSKKIWQRVVMLVSGVSMNAIFCILLLSIGFGFGIPKVLDDQILDQVTSIKDVKIQVASVSKDSPAQEAGLQNWDVIVAIDGEPVNTTEFLQNYTRSHGGQTVVLEVMRGDSRKIIEAVPRVLDNSDNHSILGIAPVKTGVVTYPWYQTLWYGIVETYKLLIALLIAFGTLIKNIISTGEVAAELAGPVGIAVLTGQVVNMGIVYVLQFAALLSLNLAIINILPIPALDGGRVLFLIIEKIKGNAVNQKIEALVHNIGFAVLMILIVLVTYRDLTRWGGQIIDKIF